MRITDALVTGVAGRLPSAELARRVDGLKGAVALRWSVAPGTVLGVRGIDHGPSAAEGSRHRPHHGVVDRLLLGVGLE